ncbi:MAG: hypothetical protein H6517_08515 [Microthrixaceae bacterium]|nr:hypothetical protein [Microthrixaceae bacterium]MCB1010332.1 hypothetical protein [Microthrixaceae bacterium]MCB9387854.1 hypothetical protein [Microthrixaceae bacterium]MCO5320315.1 hypothetical protein [Microthrixaceae bacterium]
MLETTKNLLDATVGQALELAKAANSAFRSHDDVAVALPGGMYGHVHKGRLVGFGLEPVGDVVVDSDRHVENLLDGAGGQFLWGRVAAIAGGAAAAASTATGITIAIVRGRGRRGAVATA